MRIRIDLTEEDVRKALIAYVETKLDSTVEGSGLVIETKSKQNYKSEWEVAQFRAYLFRNE